MNIKFNKLALARLRTATDNACMFHSKESMKEFWEAYEAVKDTENAEGHGNDCIRNGATIKETS